jgi:hypothetical protein
MLSRGSGLLLSLALLLVACAGAAAPTPTPTPSARPSPAPPSASAKPSPSGVVVTFDVGGERYRVLVIDPAQIAIAQQLLTGQEAPAIPNGRIVRGDPSVNIGWSWHIDPTDFAFADMTTEVCDGLPSYVEDGSLTGDRFCPWTATVVAVDPIE